MIPLFFAQQRGEIAVCALIDLVRSGFGHRLPAMGDAGASFARLMPEMLALLQSGEHPGS